VQIMNTKRKFEGYKDSKSEQSDHYNSKYKRPNVNRDREIPIKPSDFVSRDTLRISNIKGDISTRMLMELLEKFGKVKNISLSEDKTECFVQLDSVEHSVKAKDALQHKVWPDEALSNPLQIDFTDIRSVKAFALDDEQLKLVTQQEAEREKKAREFLQRYFPLNKDPSLFAYEEDGLTYLTPHWFADKLTQQITDIYHRYSEKHPVTIIDATAGLGGDVVSFALCQQIRKVVGIELFEKRFKCLEKNVQAYKEIQRKVTLVNGDFLTWFDQQLEKEETKEALKTSVAFADPPWGGVNYKYEKVIPDLFLNDASGNPNKTIGMADLCTKVLKYCPMIVLKLPFNFDIAPIGKLFKYEKWGTNKILFVAVIANWFGSKG